MSFYQFEKYIEEKKLNIGFREKILPKIKELIALTFEAVKHNLNPNDRKYCFEIFGYDFIIDSIGNVWLIEVNTNPCIEESSPLLKMLIPRMLDDAFKMTLDALYPSKYTNQFTTDTIYYGVNGYSDQENMWEPINTNDFQLLRN